MTLRTSRVKASVGQLCDFLAPRHSVSSWSLGFERILAHQTKSSQCQYSTSPQSSVSARRTTAHRRPTSRSSTSRYTTSSTTVPTDVTPDILVGIEKITVACDRILATEIPPAEGEILSLLSALETLALRLLHPNVTASKTKDGSAASLLSAVGESNEQKDTTQPNLAIQAAVNELSSVAFELMVFPPTFITPKILEAYVDLQYILQKPESLPEIFYLYSNKPIPEEGSTPLKYTKQKPDKAANAVPVYVADRALQTAIDTRQLAVAMNIVGTSYATPASRKAKFIKKGLLPVSGLAAAPVAAYAIATQFGLYQSSMEPQMATNMAFVGILAYVGCTTTLGVVAVTTANDQMIRVTWATGMPLRQRWMREEERSAIDKIAVAWGFRQVWRRGEEEGEDWDTLREWIGRKGMVLDRSELMEGME